MIVINPITTSYGYKLQQPLVNKKYSVKSQMPLSFRAQPWPLDVRDLGVSQYGSISANDGIKLYEKLKCGNYLDIGDDKINYSFCSNIRKSNLAFLDRIVSSDEQKKFVDYYKDLTGFPNFFRVSEKIKNEFKNALRLTVNQLRRPEYKIMQAGYDGVCSVGRYKAFPGSDLDKAYVIIQGTGDSIEDVDAVNKFKGGIWFNTDQRILSYNHDEAAFPQVYTITQVEKLVDKAEQSFKYDGVGFPQHHYNKIIMLKNKQDVQMQNFNEDYVEANPYFIKLAQNFDKSGNDVLSLNYPSRENIKNIGFVLEALREGETFKEFGVLNSPKIIYSDIYNYTNLSQLHALKNHGDRKPKRLAREELGYKFNTWEIPKQFRFVKSLIKASCGNNNYISAEFEKYFSKPGQDLFAALTKAIMR